MIIQDKRQSDLKTAMEQILPELLRLYPLLEAVAVSGSRVTGKSHEFSDWDFVVLDESIKSFKNDDRIIDGRHCEVFVADFDEWQRVIREVTANNVPVFMQMVAESQSLIESVGFTKLRSHTKRLFEAGPPALTEKDIRWHIQQIDFAIDKIKGVGLIAKPLFKHGITQNLLDTWYVCQNCWRVKPVERDEFIKNTDPYFYDQINKFQVSDSSDNEDIAIELFAGMSKFLRSELKNIL